MKKYTVLVEERLSRKVEVTAENPSDALRSVKAMYRNEEIVLSADDYDGNTDFDVIDEEM